MKKNIYVESIILYTITVSILAQISVLQPIEMMHQKKHRVHFEDETEVISYGIEERFLTLPDGTPYYIRHNKFGGVQATLWVDDGSFTTISKQSMTEIENHRACVIEEHIEAILKIRNAPIDERPKAIKQLNQLIDSGFLKHTLIDNITASPAFKDIGVLIFGPSKPKISNILVSDAEKLARNRAIRQSQTLTDKFEQSCWL